MKATDISDLCQVVDSFQIHGPEGEFTFRRYGAVIPPPSIMTIEPVELPIHNLQYVARAMGTDPTRPHLFGVLLDVEARCMVATDGHRLHCAPSNLVAPFSILLPAPMVRFLLQSSGQARLQVSPDSRGPYCRIAINDLCIEWQDSGAKFPPYSQVLPKDPPRLTLDIDGRKARAVLAPFTGENKAVRMVVNGAVAFQASKSEDHAELAVSNSSHDPTAPDFTIGLDSGLFRDAIPSGKRIVATIGLWEELDPIRVTSGDLSAIVMPMRL